MYRIASSTARGWEEEEEEEEEVGGWLVGGGRRFWRVWVSGMSWPSGRKWLKPFLGGWVGGWVEEEERVGGLVGWVEEEEEERVDGLVGWVDEEEERVDG